MSLTGQLTDTTRTARSTPSRWKLALILGTITAVGPLSIDMYLPAFPDLSVEFSSTAAQIQLTLTACLIGLAFGQLVAGPLSDALGRRRPLLVGVAVYLVASLLCAVAPSTAALVGLRFIQGMAGAAGLVIARAIIRDLYTGVAAAKFFSMLMLVTGAAPILAPMIGSQLLSFTSWRGVFIILAVYGLLMGVAAFITLPETLPREQRRGGGVKDTAGSFGRLFKDRSFVGYALAGGLSFATIFAYVSASPFVLQVVYQVSPQTYGLLFALNSVGILIFGQVNGWLVGRVAPRTLLSIGMTTSVSASVVLLVLVNTGWLGLPGVMAALFVVVSSLGLVMPNATTLALAEYPNSAGAASALLGTLQFLLGALAAPLVSLGGEGTALPMAIVMVGVSAGALVIYRTMTRPIPPAEQELAAVVSENTAAEATATSIR
ncbi:Bcr/CflA family multidrug efflux MFS transporter [Actinoalloteichus hymeniacidonis]|uniref:Drug resistance transporter, Bcr/CflA subfamily n=1 Tax=Actinoalloteichus hymeniacidonis TaxID=340345 RepID=A0AAC9HN70_9PSEU|nr:Bcr/CflA family multidrug efflux MFS transporter [Actinoalloteichus hymeniacidonis]AOS62253.1 drug resistance transporter, Bcr/CflA subfamily [Actinoalloteichus hymeniacidonis]MBB5909721.1 DHA1 family bicyclomycin/chloramphenicol resistance-like MFS transporter [Actinoalloteichus hymeniacidonis]